MTKKEIQEQNKKIILSSRKDFKIFLKLVWKYLKLPEPTLVQLEIADFLQSDDQRRMIQAYRGVGKTYITGAYVCWRLFKDPDEHFLIVSATNGFAEEISMFIKNILSNMPLIKHLDPAKTNRNSVMKFDVYGKNPTIKSPSVKIAGITGQITGSRATEIIADDVEVEKNSRTITMRENIRKSIKEFTNIIIPNVGRITYLGTPQTEDSIYTKLGENYNIQIWPARYPMLSKIANYGRKLYKRIREEVVSNPDLQWKPTNSKQHNDNDLIERELDSGKSNFLLQYMLDTTLSDAERFPLKVNELLVMDLDNEIAPVKVTYGTGREQQIEGLIPENAFVGQRLYRPLYVDSNFVQYEGAIMTIDPSGRGSDETGYSITKQLHGYVYILDCGSVEGGYEDITLMRLAKIAKEYKVNEIILESNFGDGIYTKMLEEILRKYYPCAVGEVRNSKQKELRIIEHLEPMLNRHKLVIDRKIIEQDNKCEEKEYSLIYQMTRITKDRNCLKHDDKLDALSMGVQYWVELLGRDEDNAIEELQRQQQEEDIRKFLNDNNDRNTDNFGLYSVC